MNSALAIVSCRHFVATITAVHMTKVPRSMLGALSCDVAV